MHVATGHLKRILSEVDVRKSVHHCLFLYTTTHCSLKAYCAILVRCSNLRHQALLACQHARAPSGGRWNCGREMSGNFA